MLTPDEKSIIAAYSLEIENDKLSELCVKCWNIETEVHHFSFSRKFEDMYDEITLFSEQNKIYVAI